MWGGATDTGPRPPSAAWLLGRTLGVRVLRARANHAATLPCPQVPASPSGSLYHAPSHAHGRARGRGLALSRPVEPASASSKAFRCGNSVPGQRRDLSTALVPWSLPAVSQAGALLPRLATSKQRVPWKPAAIQLCVLPSNIQPT